MDAFIGFSGLALFFTAVIYLIITLIKKNNDSKKALKLMGIGLAMFVFALMLTSSKEVPVKTRQNIKDVKSTKTIKVQETTNNISEKETTKAFIDDKKTSVSKTSTRKTTTNVVQSTTAYINPETTGQRNAVKSVKTYLSVTAFSRSGLIKQLEFEEYTNADAVYAVDKVNPNWNDQAKKSAKNYLSVTAFSRNGLIKQLEFEGFSNNQAAYGVDNNNVDWNYQAVKAAKHYLDIMAFSRNSLISQLEFEGFTNSQAIHGATENGY